MTLPKVELHVHLEGTATPELVRRLADRNRVALPDRLLDADGRFAYGDFLHFLRTYDLAASVIRTPRDYRDITYEYLSACAREGAIYVELTASPDHAAVVGLTDGEELDGIAQGIEDARRDHEIEARILVVAIRDLGPARAARIARLAAARAHPHVVGFSMAGDEAGYPAEQFADAYAIAAAAGLGCTMHAGEWAGADSVRGTLTLPVTRIAHGVRAIEDPGLVAELARRGIVLDTCPTSNVVLGVFRSYEEHPLPRLRDAGVRLTLGSDDPPYFGATIGGEYRACAERMGFSETQLRAITDTAVDAAFCDDDLKRDLRARLRPVGG
ncbi:MAG: adenosine deaminase [Solirubrobacterales bacterium]|nr:adenosine deaminase [Solirubrobacterales bacterium]